MTHRHAFWITAMTLLIFLLGSQESRAQEATSFEQLQVLVKPGDKVTVTDSQGVATKGTITGLTSSILRLKVNSSIRDLSESDVSRIRQWRQDSLKNGALIGTGIGAGFALLGILSCRDYCDGSAGDNVAAGVVITGLGAAIGVGVDALIRSNDLIYIGRTRVALNLRSLKPILSPSRKGVSVSLSF